MKKAAALIITALILLTLAGCGSSVSTTDTSEGSSVSQTEDVPETEEVPPTEQNDYQDESVGHEVYDWILESTEQIAETRDGDWSSIPNDIGESIGQAGADVYYAYRDLNGDGIDDLIMGYSADNDIYVGGVCTVRDGMAYVPDLYMYSSILADGTIVVYGSPAKSQTEQFFVLNSSGEFEETTPSTTEKMDFEWIKL